VDREVSDPIGLREAAQVVRGEELPVEADAVVVTGPEQTHHVDRLIGTTTAGAEVDSAQSAHRVS
jgi:hypothetical protein